MVILEPIPSKMGDVQDEENPVLPKEETSLIQRFGPAVEEYLREFLKYLRERTGYRPDHFRTPDDLQRTMERMETARLPMEIWRACINGSVRLMALSDEDIDEEFFVRFLMSVLSIVMEYMIENVLLSAALGVLASFGIKQLTAVVILIYHFINFSAKKLWAYVEKRLEKYLTLAVKNMKGRYNDRSLPQ